MTELRAYLTQAQDEDRRAGRLVFMEAPTEPCPECKGQFEGRMPGHVYGSNWHWVPCQNGCDGGRVPISDTVPCPECEGGGVLHAFGMTVEVACSTCGESGRVPRVVEVVRPNPPTRVARAQVEALPVVDLQGHNERVHAPGPFVPYLFVLEWSSDRRIYLQPDRLNEAPDITYAFPDGSPEPGTVLWRLHGWEAVEEQTTVPWFCERCISSHDYSPCPECGDDNVRAVPLPDLPPGHIYATGEQP